jgi:hypothetical protein
VAALVIAGVTHSARDAVSVGDIIAFEPEPEPITTGTAMASGRIAVHRPNQFGCILDLETIRRFGGSLVAEARLASEGLSFRMHWAGEHTAPGSGDCGPNADLIVERADLSRLAAAAGGYIVGGIHPIGGGVKRSRDAGL